MDYLASSGEGELVIFKQKHAASVLVRIPPPPSKKKTMHTTKLSITSRCLGEEHNVDLGPVCRKPRILFGLAKLRDRSLFMREGGGGGGGAGGIWEAPFKNRMTPLSLPIFSHDPP